LPAHVKVHARPAVSGTIDGITDVRRYGNFCDPEKLEGYSKGFLDLDEATMHQTELMYRHGIECGPSSGAAFGIAQETAENPDAVVAFICADGKVRDRSRRAPWESTMAPSFFTMGSRSTHGFFARAFGTWTKFSLGGLSR
jgi:hypothetical protein